MGIDILKIPIQSETIKPYIKAGDTIPKIDFAFDASDNIDLNTSNIRMQIYSGTFKFLDISKGSGITVTGQKTFEIDSIKGSKNPFKAGVYLGDLEIIDGSGVTLTHFNIEYTILKQYTK